MGPPTVNQRVEQLEEKATEIKESMAEMVVKTTEIVMKAIKYSLTDY